MTGLFLARSPVRALNGQERHTGAATVNILDAIDDPNLFAPWFRDRGTWQAWMAYLRALFCLPMTPEQVALYCECTGRTAAPTAPATESWLVCGRRAGKSFILALIAVFLACFK